MPLTFFAGNSRNSGAALFVTFNSKDGSVFGRFLKQTGWDTKTKKASFQGGETINVKFSQDEAADFIRVVRTKGQSKFYHSFGDEVTTGNFSYYKVEADGNKPTREGFGLTIKKGEAELKVGFSLGAAERFSEYLKFALTHIFSAIYSEDKKQAEEYLKNKQNKETKSTKKAAKEEYLPNEEEQPTEDVSTGDTENKDSDVDF